MSHSANHKSKKDYFNYLDKDYFEDSIQKVNSCKRDLSKKDQSNLRMPKLKSKFYPTNFSNSSSNTNNIGYIHKNIININEEAYGISVIKNKNDNFKYYSYPIIEEENFENNFITKKNFIYMSPSIINNRIISFQKQENKELLEFSLFGDNLIFDGINKSYLQDEKNDDGAESSDEKIEDGKNFLSEELENSIKKLSKSLQKNQNEKLLSRKMRFKNDF